MSEAPDEKLEWEIQDIGDEVNCGCGKTLVVRWAGDADSKPCAGCGIDVCERNISHLSYHEARKGKYPRKEGYLDNEPPQPKKETPKLRPSYAEAYKVYFAKAPVVVINEYLESFNDEGDNFQDVPKYILEFLADRFRGFMYEEYKTLDQAFGGKTARQRNAILQEESDKPLVWDHKDEYEKAKELKKIDRCGKPSEHAVAEVAKKYGLKESRIVDAIKRSRKTK